MILAVLAAATVQATAVDAERAFAARAQTEGMWTAFRATAADDAAMFVPQQVKAQEWLKGRKDPRTAYMWWPAEAYVSCDGSTAITTGPSVLGGARGYFTTVWSRQADGKWKWLLDHGDRLDRPRPAREQPLTRRASCRSLPSELREEGVRGHEIGTSPDRSLVWRWNVYENGARIVWAELWNGRSFVPILEDKVEAPR